MSTLQTVVGRGVAASRPAAASTPIGATYYSTDVGITERNTGSAWEVVTGWGLIQEQLLGSDVATVTFTLPTTSYRHLRLSCYGRTTEAVTDNYVYLQFNGDTAANYDFQQGIFVQTGTSVANSFAQTKIRLGEFAGASAAAAGNVGYFEVIIPHYLGTTFNKITSSGGGGVWGTAGSTTIAAQWFGQWRSTAAITSFVLSPSANNFKTGSIFSLYGML